jgi:hypothetical protein
MTRMPNAPSEHSRKEFKTYSFYYDNGRLFVYPREAHISCIGDGSGNPSLRSNNPDSGMEENDGSSDSSDSSSSTGEEDEDEANWSELSFTSYPYANTTFSRAMFRGTDTTIQITSSNHQALAQLIPDRYHRNGAVNAPATNNNALAGEIPILIALVIFSVHSNLLEQALIGCFHNVYQPHALPPGQGCK